MLKYDKAKLALINVVARERLRIGDRLPSERSLAGALPFSSITIRRALKDLESVGIIRKEHGRGSFLSKAIDFSPVIGDLGVLRVIRKDRPHSSPGRLFELSKYLRSRGIGLKYFEADEFNKDLIDQAPSCFEWVNYALRFS